MHTWWSSFCTSSALAAPTGASPLSAMYFWTPANIFTARVLLSALSFSSEVGMQSCTSGLTLHTTFLPTSLENSGTSGEPLWSLTVRWHNAHMAIDSRVIWIPSAHQGMTKGASPLVLYNDM